MFSLASVATMAACIFLFGLFFSIVLNFTYIVKGAEEGVAITVFFDEGIDQAQIDEIGVKIKARKDEVKDVVYKSADESWEEFQQDYLGGNTELAEGFRNDNPLAELASYQVYVNDIEDQKPLIDYIESLDGVREVNHSDQAVNTLTTFNKLLSYISLAIILILLAVAIFLISNTVAVGISIRKEEIGIMKLVGATNGFVKAPFIIEGILIGLVGAVIPLALLYVLYNQVVGYVLEKFTVLNGFMQFLPVGNVFRLLLPVGLLLGMGIGLIGSLVTIRKHLKV